MTAEQSARRNACCDVILSAGGEGVINVTAKQSACQMLEQAQHGNMDVKSQVMSECKVLE